MCQVNGDCFMDVMGPFVGRSRSMLEECTAELETCKDAVKAAIEMFGEKVSALPCVCVCVCVCVVGGGGVYGCGQVLV